MATYKGIQGNSVQKLSSDPTASEAVGQLWYNSSSGNFKIGTQSAGAWASSASVNTGGQYRVGCGNTATAGLLFGGVAGSVLTATESWNGTAWTELTGNLLVGTNEGGGATSGTQTATLSFGAPPATCETWDGTSWSEGNNMLSGALLNQSCGGTATAAIAMGGPGSNQTEIYDGTSWSEVNNMLSSFGQKAGCGSTTSAISAGGRPPTQTAADLYDGTSWATTGSLNTGRYYQGAAGDSGTAAIMFAGIPPPSGLKVTESFDGSTWTEVGDLSAVSSNMGGGVGNSTAAFACNTGTPVGGSPTNVEVWADPVYTNKTVTVS